jgi:hypothetical protein
MINMLIFFNKLRIEYYINKNKYKSVIKQLKSYSLYNKDKEIIAFAKYSIIG